MTKMERIKISELVTKYELEPSLRDIYVEGEEDVYCLNTFLRDLELKKVKVFPIDLVDVPNDLLEQYNFENNNRGRVIGLAKQFSDNHLSSKVVTCIIDRDFDSVINVNHENELIFYTDFSCMEMYIMNEEVLERFLSAHFIDIEISAFELINVMGKILQELFLIRLANKELSLNLKYLSFHKQITFDKTKIYFDRSTYIRNYLSKTGMLYQIEDIEAYIMERRKLLQEDFRFYVQGHDFIQLFTLFINSQKKEMGYNPYTIWKTCYLSTHGKSLLSYELFKKIYSKVC